MVLSWLFGTSFAQDDDDTAVHILGESSVLEPPPHIVGCSSSNHTSYIHDAETWRIVQRAYDEAKGKPHDRYGRARGSHTGVSISYHVELDPTVLHGRVLVADQDVPKGTQIWKPYHYGQFKSNSQRKYYKFLSLLPHHLQCDVLEMSHAMYDGSVIEVALDEGNFIHDAEVGDQVNLDLDCVAVRDIPAGSRFYMNYSHLFEDDASPILWFEELKERAFARSPRRFRGGSMPTNTPTSSKQTASVSFLNSNVSSQSSSNGIGYFLPTVALMVAMFGIKSVRDRSINNKRNNKYKLG
jgi:hypothetical protein